MKSLFKKTYKVKIPTSQLRGGEFMKKLILIALLALILPINTVSATYQQTDDCDELFTYQKTSDYSDSRVNINFESGDDQIDVSAKNGYQITNVWLEVDGVNISGWDLHFTTELKNYNPNPGGDIDEVKVEVQKVCAKVIICHATSSQSNSFTKIPVNDDAVDGNGNGSSDHNRSDHQGGEDIIPPGYWDANGRNWDSVGQAIYNNNCVIPEDEEEEVTPTPTPTPIPTPTPTPGGGDDEQEITPTPTTEPRVTPTATPSATVTEDPDKCPNNDLKFLGIQSAVPVGAYVNENGNCVDSIAAGTGGVLAATATTLPATGPESISNLMALIGSSSLILGGALNLGLANKKLQKKLKSI